MMTPLLADQIKQRVERIETTPAIPSIFMPLLDMLNGPEQNVRLDEVVRLVSFDNTIAAQCLRVASSPLFGLSAPPHSIRAAVISLGMRRLETILLTCCLGQAFPAKDWALDPAVFWRHSLGCAMVCRKFSEKLKNADCDRAYMAGLLHDIGFVANCIAFPNEFARALDTACREQISLDQAELREMGFTHCQSGRFLAEKWSLSQDLIDVITNHHDPSRSDTAPALVALVHLCDMLCRMRSLGYGYYESRKVDLVADPAWAVLLSHHKDLDGVDLMRFTFELDEAIGEIYETVSLVFGA